MFYGRQLSWYNLGVHLSDLDYSYMCLWEQSLTGRGGNKISSSPEISIIVLMVNFPRMNKLAISSDNCIGQNKNKVMLLLLMHLVASGEHEYVEPKFLVSVH